MHVDTGHNFPEVIEFRDKVVEQYGLRLEVASVQDLIDEGIIKVGHELESRNRHQTRALLDAIRDGGFDAVFGGGRRDEDKARAKERVLSFRDKFGQWDPKNQRPELWRLYNGRHHKGEHIRVFPISDWTELDVWRYLAREEIELPPIYFAHEREVVDNEGLLMAVNEFFPLPEGAESHVEKVRYRTVGDATLTGAVSSPGDRLPVGDRGDLGLADHRARRDPRRRPFLRSGDGGPEARGVLLVPAELLRIAHRRVGGRRQVDPDRAAAATTPNRSSKTSSSRSSGPRRSAATSRPTWRS